MGNKSAVRVPLWVVLNVPFAVILLFSAGLVAYLGFQNGTNTANDLTRQLMAESSSRIQENLNSFLAIPQLLNDHNRIAIRLKQLDFTDTLSVQRQFLPQLLSFNNIAAITFASEQREFIATAWRPNDLGLAFTESSAQTGFTFKSYEANLQGERGEQYLSVPDYDPRTRPWYKAAVTAEHATWTPIFIWTGGNGIGLDSVTPIYAENDDLLGVLDVSLYLSGISKYLQDAATRQHSNVFIVDDSGLLVASSTILQPYARINDQLQRFDTLNSADPFIQSATRRVTEEFGGWSSIKNSQQFEFDQAGEKSLAQVTPYESAGLRWWIVAAIPETTYMTPINKQINQTLLLIIASMIISVALLTFVSWRITHPILRLSQASKSLANGNWTERVTVNRRDEVGELAASFNQMADQLQQSTASLQANEARLRAIFENSADAIVVANGTSFISYNPAFQAMFKVTSPNDLIGKPILDIIAPTEHVRIGEYIRRRSQGEAAPVAYETIGLRQDGTELDLEVRVSTFLQDGTNYSLAILRNITERKQAEQALQESETRFRTITEVAPLGIAFSRDGIILYENRTYLNMFGYQQPEEVNGLHLIQHVALQNRDEILDRVRRRAMGETVPDQYETTGLRKDGSEFPFAVWINRMNFPDGPANVSFLLDLTERKQAEAIMREQSRLQLELEKQKEVNDLKSRFVSMASHEFRTPLASILAVTETLGRYREKLTEEQLTQRLDKIREHVNHLKVIIEDMLNLARLQARRADFHPTTLNLNVLSTSVLDEFRSQPDIKHEIVYTCNDAQREVKLDPKLMRQIIANLVSNAVKYSPSDKPIIVSLDYTNEAVALKVRDAGIGIPEPDLKHLFEPFHRAVNVGAVSGTGLGLVITKELVELHGGTITVESQVGVGTTFTVNIPLEPDKGEIEQENANP